MSYNIRIGIGMDGETDLGRIADAINRITPDYVGLQEVDSVCERSFWVNQYAELAKHTGDVPDIRPSHFPLKRALWDSSPKQGPPPILSSHLTAGEGGA